MVLARMRSSCSLLAFFGPRSISSHTPSMTRPMVWPPFLISVPSRSWSTRLGPLSQAIDESGTLAHSECRRHDDRRSAAPEDCPSDQPPLVTDARRSRYVDVVGDVGADTVTAGSGMSLR